MKNLILFSVMVLLPLGSVAGPKSPAKTEKKHFGGKVSLAANQSLKQVVKDFAKHRGQTVALTAIPKKVCEKKGCWMVLQDGDLEIRTTFKDYGFFVPKRILNQKVKVQGVLEQKEISAATQRHYLKDGGASPAEIKKVTQPKTEYQFIADAVEII